jgi:3-phenylpropionate/cinnamic acid dioxygenase small subunit
MELDEVIAREAIRKTINGYTLAGDARDGAAFHPLFAEDAVLEFEGFGPAPAFRSVGRDEIRARTASWSPVPGKDPSLALTSFIRHNLTSCEIELTGHGAARAKTYFIVFTDVGPDHMGTYSDELVRKDGRWLFQHRRIALQWRSPDSVFPPLPADAPETAGGPRQANIDLMNRYAHALDARDWELFNSLFTENATFHGRQYLENAVRPDEDFLLIEGREAIAASIRGIWDGLSATHHMLANHMVELAPDRRSARCSCYLRAHHVGNRERSQLFEESLGRFDFETVLEGSAWKIRRMDENIFHILGTSDAFAPVEA